MLKTAEGFQRLQADLIIAFVCFYEKTLDKLFSVFKEDKERFVLMIYKKNHGKKR